MSTEMITIDSPLPAAVAFERLLDLTQVTSWDRGIASSRQIGGTAGTVGARYAVGVTGFDGRPTTAEYEVVAIGDLTFTMIGSHPDFRADDTVTAVETPDGCRVTYDASLVLLGDDPPISNERLDATFAKLVAVVEDGLRTFLAD